ncbi:hypothetical protein CGLAR1_12590 [Corynebacterium glutamicum]|uniref:phage major capsid protein n=1 Tax=Corynebacterium glutamicum TaxID=1718 RepID=UPI0004F83F38|nr:phage major capsid protein [Corynebacterium glutamicum]AIK86039.1 hypothetical protein CGLAR1_12590 [Corynebacterium glutamicum]AIK88822.1 hypothetical protein AR0_12725 [Corynebacterium glutamicum]
MSNTVVSPGAPVSLSPDRVTYHPQDLIRHALIYQITNVIASAATDRDSVRVPRIASVPDVGFVAEGDEIPGGDVGLGEVAIRTRKLAVTSAISNELRNASSNAGFDVQSAQMITDGITVGLIDAADRVLLSHESEGADDPLEGLSTISGVTTIPGALTNLDPVTDAIGALEAEGGRFKDFNIVMHPSVWSTLAKLKTADGSNVSLVDSIQGAVDPGSRRLAGIPVHTSQFAKEGELLMIDRESVLSVVTNVELGYSDEAQFLSDSRVFRVTYRAGWKVTNPKRIAKISITG